MKTVLILGASGYLGSEVFQLLKRQKDFNVYGSYFTNYKQDLISIDLLNENDLHSILNIKPDVIIWCVMDVKKELHLSNFTLRFLLKHLPSKTQIIYISTTVGKGMNQTERTIPINRNSNEYLYEYINGKILGEQIVRDSKNFVIIRPGSIYGKNSAMELDNRSKLLLNLYANKEKNYIRTANMFMSYVHVKDLAQSIFEIINNSFYGILNVAGSKEVSHYTFYQFLSRELGIDSNFIKPDFLETPIYHNLSASKRKRILKSYIREIEI